MRRFFLLAALIVGSAIVYRAVTRGPTGEARDPDLARRYSPSIASASNEAKLAARAIQAPSGMRVDVFAAEPLLANPVCFAVDEHNRFYVAETFRLHAGVTDIRDHMDWLDQDLASRTVADRVAMMKQRLGKKAAGWAVEHDRVRLIEDTTGTGKADRSTVFADGFHHLADGLGAGLATRHGNVWYSCIPDLWLLRDTSGAGKADVRKSLHTGYGLHVGFIGHDLHGLRLGPDGKIYFSSGDRGLNVQTGGRTVASPDTGAVLRCYPDGSDLEVFATGLRNPQELVFDQYGNLFTGDNNADHGDKARWVYVVDGGDSGWRIGYQFMDLPVALGPWNAEKLWYPQWDGQAAYLVPPIANVCDGPAGLTYHPGTSQLPARYKEHFFLCDFRGGSGAQSGVRSFAVKPKGASFEFVDQHQCVWSVLATDVDFGMDGALYVSDWVQGWEMTGKGRLYKVHDPRRAQDPVLLEVKKLMADGMAQRPLAELARLLEHADMRVRQEAQFAIVDRSVGWPWPRGKDDDAGKDQNIPVADAVARLSDVARHNKHALARLHAVWGLGQMGRKTPQAFKPLIGLLADHDAEVRGQAAKVLGEGRVAGAFNDLRPLLKDPSQRVRFFAALALGKLGRHDAFGPVLHMLRDNGDHDPYVRHAGVMALARINDRKHLLAAVKDSSPAVRLGVLLALRRLASPEVAQFLDDTDSRLVLEAARAINDVPIQDGLPALAALSTRTGLSEPLLYRVLNANFRLGKAENAAALAAVAARADAPDALRVEAMLELAEWARPSGRDRIVGLWRPLAARPAKVAADALRPALGGIFSGSDRVREEGARLAGKLGIKEVGPLLFDLIGDQKRPARVRVEALKALDTLKDDRLEKAMRLALADHSSRLRSQGQRVLVRLHPGQAITALEHALDHGDRIERQGALSTLGRMPGTRADALLSRWLDKLLAGQVPLEIQLDLLEAAARRRAADIKQKLTRFEAARPKNDPLAGYHETLEGGDAEAGRAVFFTKAEVSCVRCHKVQGVGGEVGPDLSKVGAQQKREYLLESLIDPNKQIAKGFETVVLSLTDGQFVTGIVKTEDARQLRLITAEGQVLTVAKDQIDDRAQGKSAMPQDIAKFLSKDDLRNLVEFLAGLK
ncbi:MAG TPA: HEAT repeat domain-containing protein [Gemmataceae bacterium]|jgi:quinoprotein glucose dehydrogenase|nr:HEAT repeat domain-containing protein [Gemmataceae bacterium]